GLQFPHPDWVPGQWGTLAGFIVGCVGAWGWSRHAHKQRDATGKPPMVLLPGLVIVVVATLAGWLAGAAPARVDVPERTEIHGGGGGAVTPEFLTVLLGLTIYTASYIAEVVRAGIQSVPYGQHEASLALGLTRAKELRLVQLPQALRVIIPPLTNQDLNLTKNSSLAVAV